MPSCNSPSLWLGYHEMTCLHGNKKNLPDAAEEGHIIKMFPNSEVKISLGLCLGPGPPITGFFSTLIIPA